MECWICGADAETGEHIIKASDLRTAFGHVDQSRPIYIHTVGERNKSIRGLRSDQLKYTSRLCSTCNNQRTQQHDRAWSALSAYIRVKRQSIKATGRLDLGKVFPGTVHGSMLNVHLFFLKHFGCLIADSKIPLDIARFSHCIKVSQPHPNVHIAFWINLEGMRKNYIGRSHVQTAALGNVIVYAGWFYILEHIAANVQYAMPTERRKGLTGAWHPSTITKFVHVM